MTQRGGGLGAWLVQRLSAVYLALFTVAALAWLILHTPWDYASWRALFARPAVSIASGLFFLALMAHAWVGVRDVILDYIGNFVARMTLLALLLGGVLALALWALQVLWTAAS